MLYILNMYSMCFKEDYKAQKIKGLFELWISTPFTSCLSLEHLSLLTMPLVLQSFSLSLSLYCHFLNARRHAYEGRTEQEHRKGE
jgi:hypothetical protein